MTSGARRLGRLSSILLILGGALWVCWAIFHATEPGGCVGSDCNLPGHTMRQTGRLDAALVIPAVLALAAGLIGLLLRVREVGRFGRRGRSGIVLSASAFAVLVVSVATVNTFVHGNFPMPLIVVPAMLALICGFILLGLEIIRSGMLPRWSAVVLIVSTLLLLAANEQTVLILLAIPFGLSWIAIGSLLQFASRNHHATGLETSDRREARPAG